MDLCCSGSIHKIWILSLWGEKKQLAVYVHKLGREKNKVIFETIYQHYLFISILNTAKKVRVYTGDTDLGIDLVLKKSWLRFKYHSQLPCEFGRWI